MDDLDGKGRAGYVSGAETWAVERAIDRMREDLSERITVDDLAESAMFSKFYFSRTFRKVTGFAPLAFLSALRLAEAKRLLVSTSLTVLDITLRVGYTSVGTFSSRFRMSVGVSPLGFRRMETALLHSTCRSREETEGDRRAGGRIAGTIWPSAATATGRTFIGVFDRPFPSSHPVRCAALDRAGAFELKDVPEGDWYVLARSVDEAEQQEPYAAVGSCGPLSIGRDTVAVLAGVQLKSAEWLFPLLPGASMVKNRTKQAAG